ncbi:MAG: class I SAM-dependent RNA methyltransferase [Anaerolineaceae bacterium]
MPADISAQIEKLVYGGDGLGRLPDGRTVFVPFVLPGEQVLIHITEEKNRFVRGQALEILSSSPLRIAPRCPHFGVCGGCHYQQMEYEQQVSSKLAILQDQLERIGGIANAPLTGITACSSHWNYRNQMQFHPNPQGKLGFMDISGGQIVEIQECHLPLPGVSALWPQIELGPDAGLTRLTLREDSFGEQMLLLEGKEENGPEVEFDLPVSACYLNPDGSTVNLAGQDALTYSVLDRQLTVSPESFFQVNLEIAQEMIKFVLEHLPSSADLKIMELYSGVGLFSVFLAERASQLTAIESSPSACYDFATNLDAFDHVSLYEGAVEQVLPALVGQIEQPDLVFLDPPRAGLHPKARETLAKLESPHIIYVSCDPSTLARDLKNLCAAGYDLVDVHGFDMFPQTYHVETIVVIRRAQRVTS